MTSRIDFLRFVWSRRVSGMVDEDAYPVTSYFADAAKALKPEYSDAHNAKKWWDGKTEREYLQIEIWGELAEYIAHRVSFTTLKYCTRIDYRVELPEPQYEARIIELAMEARGSTKARYMKLNSADKKNQKGRAYGGVSYYSGSAESERRMVYYRRANDNWVCECRFQGSQAKRIVQAGYERRVSAPTVSVYDALSEAACTASHALIDERTGLNPAVLLGEEKLSQQELIFSRQESLLEQIDALWDELDAEARLAFAENKAAKVLRASSD